MTAVAKPEPLLISVVIPSLNQGAYLEQAMQSVLQQSYPHVELIVMDGGSTDATIGVLEKHRESLAYSVSAPDEGPAAALNAGFRRARGDIFAVLNADDHYLPGALESVAQAFSGDESADVVSGHGYFTDGAGALGVPTFSDTWNERRFRHGACVLVQPATFFRADAFKRAGGFRNSGRVCWDMELWAALAVTGARFRSIDAFLAAFRLHNASITGRAELRRQRRDDARAVMAELKGRPELPIDRLLHLAHRVLKFSSHPLRTLRQRAFVHSVLKRWSL
jgi:glycosyltransferase involved in cell wall biosynthesis